MAFISHPYRFLFVMSPRTGCTSIAYGVIVPHLEGTRVPWKDILDDDGKLLVDSKHSTIPDLLYYGLVSAQDIAALFKVCAVRNPFDSLVSLFVKTQTTYSKLVDDPNSFLHKKPGALEDVRRAADLSFSDWVKDRYLPGGRMERLRAVRPRHMYERYLKRVDHIMRFERLHEDLDEVLAKIGAPTGMELANINPTPRAADYRSYYTDEARKIVEQVFRPDLERFGYRF
ncbi:MAG TPA: sulfotransferase family 2 domain-containing protein [Actinomycetota bacterium]|nr:sulfotransferase family 2 domain-containing protein [Actinomycetota bacterium]